MMVVASGHPGVQAYCRREGPESLVVVDTWAEARETLADADKVLVGQHLADFAEVLRWIEDGETSNSSCTLTLWVEAGFEHSALEKTQLAVWRGEIDRQALQEWWAAIPRRVSFDLEASWLVASLFPYPSIAPLMNSLGEWADTRFGRGGGWIDLDWSAAELSLWADPELFGRRDYPFGNMRVHKLRRGLLVPAPPPWIPGSKEPTGSDLESLMRLAWTWRCWYLGTQIGTPWSLELIRMVNSVVLWASPATPRMVLERTVAFIELYRSDAAVIVVRPGDLDVGHPPVGGLSIATAGEPKRHRRPKMFSFRGRRNDDAQ